MSADVTKLSTRLVDKPWGRRGIDPRFGVDADARVGEIWYEAPAGRHLDVLAKYLFTSERLSIQVHPDEATAQARGHEHGKDECWIVLDVEPGAELGIGTVREMSANAVIEAACAGTIEQLVDWRPALRGQFIYNPAGTVHALGPGLTVLEVQQSVDVTYRLYDYGRARELHLEESRDIMNPRPHRHAADRGTVSGESRVLVDGPFFGLAWCEHSPPSLPASARDVQLLPIDAPMRIGQSDVAPGECALLTQDAAAALASPGAFVLAWTTEAS